MEFKRRTITDLIIWSTVLKALFSLSAVPSFSVFLKNFGNWENEKKNGELYTRRVGQLGKGLGQYKASEIAKKKQVAISENYNRVVLRSLQRLLENLDSLTRTPLFRTRRLKGFSSEDF